MAERERKSNIFTEKETYKQMELIKQDIDEMLSEKTRGAMLRSRIDWHLYGEKKSKYFFRLENTILRRKTDID